LYVLAALEVDQYKKRMIDSTMTGQNNNTTRVINFSFRLWTPSSPVTSTLALRRYSTTLGEGRKHGTITYSANDSSTSASSNQLSRLPFV
jgi:hypothetical protein